MVAEDYRIKFSKYWNVKRHSPLPMHKVNSIEFGTDTGKSGLARYCDDWLCHLECCQRNRHYCWNCWFDRCWRSCRTRRIIDLLLYKWDASIEGLVDTYQNLKNSFGDIATNLNSCRSDIESLKGTMGGLSREHANVVEASRRIIQAVFPESVVASTKVRCPDKLEQIGTACDRMELKVVNYLHS